MNKENNIIKSIEDDLVLAINNVIERERIVAEYFICQGDYKVGENLYLDLIILANDLYQIWGKNYDRERLDKYKEQISEFYEQRPMDIDIESLDPSERKNKIGIEACNIVWANNGQWIDLTNKLYLMRKQYEIQAAIKLAGKNFLEAKKIYQRIIGINEDLIKYIDDPEGKKIGVVYVQPATGKSHYAAEKCHTDYHVAASFFCEYNKENFSTSKNLIRELAFQLACQIPDYRTALLHQLESIAVPTKKINQMGLEENIDDGQIHIREDYKEAEEFDYLIVRPLSICIDGKMENQMILIEP